MGTTSINSFPNKIVSNSYLTFYKLNAESFLMTSGLACTILKPCGLTNDEGGKSKLLVGHDDELHVLRMILVGVSYSDRVEALTA